MVVGSGALLGRLSLVIFGFDLSDLRLRFFSCEMNSGDHMPRFWHALLDVEIELNIDPTVECDGFGMPTRNFVGDDVELAEAISDIFRQHKRGSE